MGICWGLIGGYGGLRGITERLRGGGLIGAPHLSSALGPAEWGSGPEDRLFRNIKLEIDLSSLSY